MSESKKETIDKLKDKAVNIIFDLITEIPDSLHNPTNTPEDRVKLLIQQASLKAATVSATLSIPAGFTGILTATTTAFCGPVAFIGLAVPHIARMLLGTENHQSLMPATIVTGAAVALLANLLCVLPGDKGIIPLNAVTPIIGAPVIIYVIAHQRRNATSDSL